MTIRTCQRDTRPESWYIGRRMVFAGKVWELAEIEGDKYHWIELRDAVPGETTAMVNEDLDYGKA